MGGIRTAHEMTRQENLFFLLLRYGLWDTHAGELPEPLPTTEEWGRVWDEAKRQTVRGLLWSAIRQLPREQRPPQPMMWSMLAAVDAIERSNEQMTEAVRASRMLLRQEGVEPILMKGLAIALLYPHPEWRECGDIDWFIPSNNVFQALPIQLRKRGIETTSSADGSLSFDLHGVDVELHQQLIDIEAPQCRKVLFQLRDENEDETLRYEDENDNPNLNPNLNEDEDDNVTLRYENKTLRYEDEDETLRYENKDESLRYENGGSSPSTVISTPSPLLSLVMLNAHLMKHAFTVGVGLRQFCDMARAYHTWHSRYDADRLSYYYRRLGMQRWTDLMHSILTDYLGLPAHELPFPLKRKEADSRRLMRTVLEEGNFGQHTEAWQSASGSHANIKRHTVQQIIKKMPLSMRYAPWEMMCKIGSLAVGQWKKG